MTPTIAATPLLVASHTSTTTMTTASFTPAVGEIIVVKRMIEDASFSWSANPSGGSLTYTSRVADGTASHCRVDIFTAVVGTSTSMTISSGAVSGSGIYRSMCVERWTGAQLAATPATCDTTGTGAPSTTITTVASNSIVSWGNADFAAVSPASRAYRSSATESAIDDESAAARYVGYFAYQTAAGAGSQTLGLTAPTGQTWTLLGIEIQDSGGAAATVPDIIMAPLALRYRY